MIIYPKCENLKIAITCSSALGILPSQFMFPENKKMRRAYTIFSIITLIYWTGFIISANIELFLIVSHSPIRKDLMSLNLCITLMYVLTLARRLIIILSPSFKKMIETVIEEEAKGDPMDDELIEKLVKESIKEVDFKCKIYLYFVIAVCFLYLSQPILIGPTEETYGNVTRFVKELPVSSWFPFDVQEHYKIAYAFQFTSCSMGGPFVVVTDILMISLIFHPCRQLRKLDHFFRNFHNFKLKYQSLNAIAGEEEAAFLFFKHLINRHETIIQYVDTYNKNMAYPMLFDFIQSSVQIASVLTQLTGDKITLMTLSTVATFWTSMLIRLFLYYYSANEILNLSQKLSYSIWASNWPDESPKIKVMVLIFIMRAQKPLAFNIGPFSQMSSQSLISVLKATYSYVTLIVA